MFLECSFTITFFNVLKDIYHFTLPTSLGSLVEYLYFWLKHNPSTYYIPYFVYRCVWIAWNKGIFEGSRISLASLTSNIGSYFQSFPILGKKKKIHNIGHARSLVYPAGFFYGGVVDGIGGVGIYLAVNSNHYFHIKLGCGGSTNTREKLLAMWALLH